MRSARYVVKRMSVLAAPLVLSACATYHAKPLPQSPDWSSAKRLTLPVRQLQVPALKPHPFNAAKGLDMTDVVTLAVVNNPDLKAQRAQAGVAAAQLLVAGLLPNPQISVSFLHPTGGPPPIGNGYSLGLTEDLTALISRGAKRASARAHAKQVNMNILWQEWQVAQRARQLYIRARSEASLDTLLVTQQKLYAANYRREQKALGQGNLTLSTTSADLVLLVNANTQLRQLQRQHNSTWHALDALLDLQPDTKPRLAGPVGPVPFSQAQFKLAVARLPKRRPDLIALQAGYQSQEASVREAILKQFPTLSIGPSGGTDTGKVTTIGIGANLSLPLFNQNQGQIAVARATRAVLRQTYQARLDQAVNQAHKTWREIQIMQRQLQQLEDRLPALKQTTDAAQRAFAHGNMSAGTFINLRSSLLSKQVEAIRLKASLAQTQAALETLLGMTIDTRGATSNRDKS
ncbi:MAG: TolC family protein [Salinisphaera sp.]|jgi:cobalt-zinc-cadmium efflux system outer membrane protein|nr:TolC family protein [Salinisphaera sp.]